MVLAQAGEGAEGEKSKTCRSGQKGGITRFMLFLAFMDPSSAAGLIGKHDMGAEFGS